MILYEFARKVNRRIKAERKRRMGRFVSPVRRIEFVHPIPGERVCAMTFDDGPFGLPASPDVGHGESLTKLLSGELAKRGFSGTFDIVGDTSENYPDEKGDADSFYWGGKKFDHYPRFGEDAYGGAKNCPGLVKYLLDSGMELANHGYRHLLFGRSGVYSERQPFSSLNEVTDDLLRLHRLIEEDFGYTMKLGRPAHYIDNIAYGFTSYDAYDLLGYNYVAASFDGGGWMPSKSDYDETVREMAEPLKKALEDDPEALNGKIIFQKDGCNMSGVTPIASALPLQLDILQKFGYRVVSVSDMMRLSAFEDLSPDDECFGLARELDEKGFVVGYKNNTFKPDKTMTFGELCMMLCPREKRTVASENTRPSQKKSYAHPYDPAMKYALSLGLDAGIESPATRDQMKAMLDAAGYDSDISGKKSFTRREAVCELGRNILKK